MPTACCLSSYCLSSGILYLLWLLPISLHKNYSHNTLKISWVSHLQGVLLPLAQLEGMLVSLDHVVTLLHLTPQPEGVHCCAHSHTALLLGLHLAQAPSSNPCSLPTSGSCPCCESPCPSCTGGTQVSTSTSPPTSSLLTVRLRQLWV